MTLTHSLSNTFLQRQLDNKLVGQSISPNTMQRRNQSKLYQDHENTRLQRSLSHNQSVPFIPSDSILFSSMKNFSQATKLMEDEVMLPCILKDVPVDEVVLDGTVQPNNWYELFTFVRDIRSQLAQPHPFNDNNDSFNEQKLKNSNKDEEILIQRDVATQQLSSSSSSSSSPPSDECEHSRTTSNASIFDTIDQLKYHLFGLIESLDNLKEVADRVTEKYREKSTFMD